MSTFTKTKTNGVFGQLWNHKSDILKFKKPLASLVKKTCLNINIMSCDMFI